MDQSILTIDDYIAQFSPDIRTKLCQIRNIVREAAPESKEKISWGMATFVLHGNLVHFAAQKNHVGFYPAPSAITKYKTELTAYCCSKGAIQFPYTKPLPLDLISRIVRFRVAEQMALAEKSAE